MVSSSDSLTLPSARVPDAEHSIRYTSLMWALTCVVVGLCYFEVVRHFYLIKALGGYLVKIWLPPVALFAILLVMKLKRAQLSWWTRGLDTGHVFLVGYAVFGLASLFATEGLYNVGKLGLIMFAPLAVYLIILEVMQSNEALERMLVFLFWAGVVLSIHAQYVFLVGFQTGSFQFETFQTNVGEMDTGALATFRGVGGGQGETAIRTTLPGLEQTKFSGMLSLLCIGGLYLGMKRVGWGKLAYLVGSAGMFLTIVATMSRSTLAALAAGIAVYVWYNRRERVLMVPLICTGLVAVVMNDFVVDRILLLFTGSGWFNDWEWVQAVALARGLTEIRAEAHLDTVPISLDLFMSSPLLGVGISQMQSIVEVEEHNRYLYMLSTAGLLTLLPYVAFIFWLILKTRTILLSDLSRNTADPRLGCLMLAGLVFSAIKLNAENSETFYYWVFFALAAAWIRHRVSVSTRVTLA